MYTNQQEAQWRDQASAYLRREMGLAAPTALEGPLLVAGSPLEGEGLTAIFSFRADIGGRGQAPYFVAAGETSPNYYPDYGLDEEDIFSLHLGTRFMLVVEVGQVAHAEDATAEAADAARRVVEAVAPGESIEDAVSAAVFQVEGARHLVIRCRVSGEPVYVMAGDAPPGFSRRVDLPPQVVYRVHLGRILRQEQSDD